MKPLFSSVTDYFKKSHVDLLTFLNQDLPYWISVRTNTISNQDLVNLIEEKMKDKNYSKSAQLKGALALALGRLMNKIPNPG
jgi:hypothetical protein